MKFTEICKESGQNFGLEWSPNSLYITLAKWFGCLEKNCDKNHNHHEPQRQPQKDYGQFFFHSVERSKKCDGESHETNSRRHGLVRAHHVPDLELFKKPHQQRRVPRSYLRFDRQGVA